MRWLEVWKHLYRIWTQEDKANACNSFCACVKSCRAIYAEHTIDPKYPFRA